MEVTSCEPEPYEFEIAHLRGLDLASLRACWHSTFGRKTPTHLPRPLLFRILAYRLQADRLGDLDKDAVRLLDRMAADAGKEADASAARPKDSADRRLRPGTVLIREWQGTPQRVMVLADGFAWQDQVFASLSKVAFAITGTRWNGPRFFGLRDKAQTAKREAQV